MPPPLSAPIRPTRLKVHPGATFAASNEIWTAVFSFWNSIRKVNINLQSLLDGVSFGENKFRPTELLFNRTLAQKYNIFSWQYPRNTSYKIWEMHFVGMLHWKSEAFSAVFLRACQALWRTDGRTLATGNWSTLSGSLSFGTDFASGAAQKTCLMSDGHFPAGHSYRTRRFYSARSSNLCTMCTAHGIVVVSHFWWHNNMAIKLNRSKPLLTCWIVIWTLSLTSSFAAFMRSGRKISA